MKIIPPNFEKYRRADNKFYFIYRVDVVDQDKFYIGSRSCLNLNDNYYGSPSKNNDYYNILEKSKLDNYKNLFFTILLWTSKSSRYRDEELILKEYKNDLNILNINFTPASVNFVYEHGDTNNPFNKYKDKLIKLNIEKNKNWAGVYHFYHPKYGDFQCSITELIQIFRENYSIILDRGMMNLIGRLGNIRNGFPVGYKKKAIMPNNKYYDWDCIKVIKEPFLRRKRA